jgi:chromate reductase
MVLRGFLIAFRPRVLAGPEVHLAASYEAFDDNGQLKGEVYVKDLTTLMTSLRSEIGR